jgi:hypothetical protein
VGIRPLSSFVEVDRRRQSPPDCIGQDHRPGCTDRARRDQQVSQQVFGVLAADVAAGRQLTAVEGANHRGIKVKRAILRLRLAGSSAAQLPFPSVGPQPPCAAAH